MEVLAILVAIFLLLGLTVPASSHAVSVSEKHSFAKDYASRSRRHREGSSQIQEGLKLAPNGNLKDITSDSTGQYLYAAEWPGYIYRSENYGHSWNISESINAQWSGIVTDSSGQYVAAAARGGGIYTSQNYGQSWNLTSAPMDIRWSGIASDASGMNLAACWGLGNITLSNDRGLTWYNSGAPVDSWIEVVSDATGTNLYATNFAGVAYRSTDHGVTWTPVPVLTNGLSTSSILSTNGDGTVVAIAFYSGPVFVSTNSGMSYTQVADNNFWSSIIVDPDTGKQIVLTNEVGTISISTNYGQSFTESQAPDYPWETVTSSADGQFLAAAFEGDDSIFMSPDFGATWTQYELNSTQYNWYAIVSDTTGAVLTSIVYGGYIYSSADYGVTWNRLTAPYGFWYGLAASSSMTIQAAVQNYGGGYLSLDSGATWNQIPTLPTTAWSGIAMNGDGSCMAATVLGGGIWVSNSGGSSWTASNAPNFAWTAISSSADASYFVAVQGGGYLSYNNLSYVYISSDNGNTWSSTHESSSGWVSVSADADGRDVLAATSGGQMYYSNSFGVTWKQLAPPGFYKWQSVTLNSTGEFILGGSVDGGVWISFNSGVLWNLTSLSPTLQYQGVTTDNTGRIIAAVASGNSGKGGIYTSSTYGVHWTAAEVSDGSISCPAGYIIAGVLCIPCPAGYTSAAGTSTTCSACPAGSFTSFAGASYCLACPVNYYQSKKGSSSCSSCTSGYITDDTGSTQESDCRNSGGVIVLGLICLVLSVLLVNVYLCYGRLNRVSLYRKRHLIQPSLQMASQAQQLTDFAITIDSFVITTLHSVSMQSIAAGKMVVFVCVGVLVMFVTILGALIFGLVHIMFTSLVLYRGYMSYTDLPRGYREVVRRLFDAFGVRGVAHPFMVIGGALAQSEMDLTAIEAACNGGLSAQYLLIYLILAGLVLIIVRSEAQVHWKNGIEPLLTRLFSYLVAISKSQDPQHAHRRHTSWCSMLTLSVSAFLFYILPSPRKVVQFLLGYIYIFRFFEDDGHHPANQNCSDADTLLSGVTTVYVYLIILPVLVLLAAYIVPGFGHQPNVSVDVEDERLTTTSTQKNNFSTVGAPPLSAITNGEFDTDYVKFSDRNNTTSTNTLPNNGAAAKLGEGNDDEFESGWMKTVMDLLSPVFSAFSIIGGIDWILVKVSSDYTQMVNAHQNISLSSFFTTTTSSPLSSTSLASSIVSLGSAPAQIVRHIRDQSKAASNVFIPSISWLGMLSPYEKPFASMSDKELYYVRQFTWARDQATGITFMSMIIDVRVYLAGQLNVTPLTWGYSLIVKPLSYIFFCQLLVESGRAFWWQVVASYGHYIAVSLGIWTEDSLDAYDLLRDYLRFQRVFYAITGNNNRSVSGQLQGRASNFSNTNTVADDSTMYTYDSAPTINTTVTNAAHKDLISLILEEHQAYHMLHHSSGDALQRVVYDDLPACFQRYLFSILSTRFALLQLIPAFTLWSVFAVELSARVPLFVVSNRMQVLLPVWWEANAFVLARKYLAEEYQFWHPRNPNAQNTSNNDTTTNTASVHSGFRDVSHTEMSASATDDLRTAEVRTWEVWMLGFHLWSRRSRLVEFFLMFMLTVASCALVFSPAKSNQDDTVGDTDDGSGSNDSVDGLLGFVIFLLVVAGVFQSLLYLLRLHRWLFPRYRNLTPVLVTTQDTYNMNSSSNNSMSHTTSNPMFANNDSMASKSSVGYLPPSASV